MKSKFQIYLHHATESVRAGNAKTAVELVGKFIDDADLQEKQEYSNSLITIASRLSHYHKKNTLGLISYEDEVIEANKINQSLISLIGQLKEVIEVDQKLKKSSNSLFTDLPRAIISDTLYNGFLIVGLTIGSAFTIAFLILYHNIINGTNSTLEEFLYVGSFGFYGSACLSGAFDGLNRTEGLLVNWKLIAPQLVVGTLMLIAAGVVYLIKAKQFQVF